MRSIDNGFPISRNTAATQSMGYFETGTPGMQLHVRYVP
jgi:hypothetical protein